MTCQPKTLGDHLSLTTTCDALALSLAHVVMVASFALLPCVAILAAVASLPAAMWLANGSGSTLLPWARVTTLWTAAFSVSIALASGSARC